MPIQYSNDVLLFSWPSFSALPWALTGNMVSSELQITMLKIVAISAYSHPITGVQDAITPSVTA
jgi:hypothetical protein